MENNQMKNIIILKDLPSNIVEEAIVVLKQNKKIVLPEYVEKGKEGKEIKPNSKDYILKEAQMVIANYISNIENSKIKNMKHNLKIEKKYKRLKAITLFMAICFIANLIITII